MTDIPVNCDFTCENNAFYSFPEIADEDMLIVEINRRIIESEPCFKNEEPPSAVTEIKNHRAAIFKILGADIAKAQYPRHSSTESARHLMCVMSPLNILAPKWRKPYVLKNDPSHYSLGYYDFLDDKQHNGAIAARIFETFMTKSGDFMRSAQTCVFSLDRLIEEVLRLKPRVDNDFDHPDVTYRTGLSETFLFLDDIIDSALEKYPAKMHTAAAEKTTRAFFKHVCKNAGLHTFINEGKYYIQESENLESAVFSFMHWHKNNLISPHPAADEKDERIAKCMAIIHAHDRSPNGDWLCQAYRNCRPEYLKRVTAFVRYARYAKNEKNKPISIRRIRRGGKNKDLLLFNALDALAEKIFHHDINQMGVNAAAVREKRELHAESGKFISNIFSALTCWEGSETDIDVQIMDYCISRKEKWSYRNAFVHKLLALDYEQLQQFEHDVRPILLNGYKSLESALKHKLME